MLGLTLLPILIGMIHEIYMAVKYNKVIHEKDTPFYISLMKCVNKPGLEWRPAKLVNRIGRYLNEQKNDKEKTIL